MADGKPIEIQVRTILQHLWAEFSEKMADVVEPGLKYGVGREHEKALLNEYSSLVQQMEELELMPPGADQNRLERLRSQIRQLFESETYKVSTIRSRK